MSNSIQPKPFSSTQTEALLALAYCLTIEPLPIGLVSDMERVRSLHMAATAYYGGLQHDANVLVALALAMPEDQVAWTILRSVSDKLCAAVRTEYELATKRPNANPVRIKLEYDAKIDRYQSLERHFMALYNREMEKRCAQPPKWVTLKPIGTGRPQTTITNNKNE